MGVEEEDRISKLPDELLGQILSCLESPEAVQTSILSKRWVYLWTTLPCLNFEQIPYSNYGMSHYCSNFVTNFLKNRNQHSVITTFKVDCNGEYTKILDYALAHNVQNLHICNDHHGGYTCLNSAFIKTLHLTLSAKVDPMVWTLPNLTSLYLEHVKFGNRISGFDNLKELTLAGSFEIFYAQEIFTINCPNLESLILGPDFSHCTFVVSAPKLLYFEFRSSHVPDFSAGDGFPCVKEVDIDIEIEGFDWRFYDEDRIKLTMQNFIKMLNAVRATPLLKLSWETIQVLQRIPEFSEYQPSPFGNIKFLCLRGLQENPTTPNHLVTNYLLRNSPCAEILKGHLGRNPQLQNKSRGW